MPTELISVLGCERSGSAAVERAIYEAFEVTPAGDTSSIWFRGIIRNENCGCGQPFSACPFWSAVIRDAFGSVSDADARQFDRIFQGARARLIDATRLAGRFDRANAAFHEIASALYGSVSRIGGGRPIIDSSRAPAFAAAIRQLDPGAFGALHIFRDARGNVHSLTTSRNGAGLDSPSALEAAHQWSLANWRAKQLTSTVGRPSAIVSYDRFCAEPDLHLDRLKETFGFTLRRGGTREEWHRLPGAGSAATDPKDRWRSEMSFAKRLFTRAVTLVEQHMLESSADEWLRERSKSASAAIAAIAV